MTILTETKFETADYGTPEWVSIYNSCIYKLNNILTKIDFLLDVDAEGLVNGSVLKYNSSTSKFKSYKL